jgi:hypothetical protein
VRLQTLYKIPCAQEREGRKDSSYYLDSSSAQGILYKVESAVLVHFDAFDETDYERRTTGLGVLDDLWSGVSGREAPSELAAQRSARYCPRLRRICLVALLPTRLPHVRARLVKWGSIRRSVT